MEPVPLWPGDEYRIEALLARGRFANTYRAQRSGRAVALKVSLAETAPDDEALLFATRGVAFHTGSVGTWQPAPADVVRAEAEVLRGINHRAFPRVVGAGSVVLQGSPRAYLATEYVAGRTWRAMLDEGKRIPLRALVELIGVLEAVNADGTLKFHGDLKPENLFFDEAGEPRVRIIDPASQMIQMDGILPRCMLTTDAYNPKWAASDIPALGMLIIEGVTGRNPLRAANASNPAKPIGPILQMRLQMSMANGRHKNTSLFPHMPLPNELDPKVPEPVAQIALRCLELAWDGRVLEWVAAPKDLGSVRAALVSYAT